MKAFNGYDDAKKAAQYAGAKKLPAGGYVCKVLGVKYENGKDGNSDQIVLQFDICEGEFAGFFKEQYENSQQEDKKYKGQVRIYVPNDDGSDKDTWTKNSFARWTDSFEKSNTGYSWDWDEKKWKGKLVGITFGETGTVIEGKEVVYVEARSAEPIENIRSGKFYNQKFKAKNGYKGTGNSSTPAAGSSDGWMQIGADVEEEELPFN